jgi:hypothetical protein
MEINVNCFKIARAYSAEVPLDGTNDLSNPIATTSQEPLTAIAHAVLHHLMATGQLKLIVNDVEVKPHEDDEIAFDVFFNSDLDDYLK